MLDPNRVCLECRNREEEEYVLVYGFLRRNAGSTVSDIHVATKVKEAAIIAMIRSGRIVASGVTLNCTVCGREYPGSKTLMCPECAAKMDKEILKAQPEPAPKKPPKKPPASPGKGGDAFSSVRRTKGF